MTETKHALSGHPSALPGDGQVSGRVKKVALVTGAFSPVGATLAQRAEASGYEVVRHHFRAAAADAKDATSSLPPPAWVPPPQTSPLWQADLRDAGAASGLVTSVLAHYGRLDLLVLSAALFPRDLLFEANAAVWDDVWALNVRSAALLIAAAAPALRAARGQVIGVTCASVQAPMQGRAAYSVSKAALSQLLRLAALELAPEVRVNAIAPSTVTTPDEGRAQQERADAPLGAGATLADVAQAFEFIHASPGLVGAELVLDAGTYLQRSSRDLR